MLIANQMRKNFSSENITIKSSIVFVLLISSGLYILVETNLNEYLRAFLFLFLGAGAFVCLGINDDFVLKIIKEILTFRNDNTRDSK